MKRGEGDRIKKRHLYQGEDIDGQTHYGENVLLTYLLWESKYLSDRLALKWFKKKTLKNVNNKNAFKYLILNSLIFFIFRSFIWINKFPFTGHQTSIVPITKT